VTDLHPAAVAWADQAEAAAEIHGRALIRLWIILQAADVDEDLAHHIVTAYQEALLGVVLIECEE
jgi:hypothetical protein